MIDMGTEKDSAASARAENEEQGTETPEEEQEFQYDQQPFVPWKGTDGLLITIFGIGLPALIIATTGIACLERICRLAFKHPVETLFECALVLLVPVANYITWSVISRKDSRKSVRTGLLNGTAI